MIKLKDIAREAGMSVTQVSRALNNHHDVSEETKKRITSLAKEMGYVKNKTAKNLAMQVSNQVALIIKGFEDQSNAVAYNTIYPILCGINDYINEVKCELVVYILQDHVDSYIAYFEEKGISKAILYGFDYDDEKLHTLLESQYLCVCIDIPVEGENKGCVVTNNTQYALQAVEELIESGKKDIAMISGTPHAIVSIEREAGYTMALRKNKIDFKEAYIVNAHFKQEEAKELTIRLLEKYPMIDAFFCASDYMALGCMEAIQEMGKHIPSEIALIGFDNIPITKYVYPKLSTVAQDDRKKGYESAKLLVEMAEGKTVGKTISLSCELILRESI